MTSILNAFEPRQIEQAAKLLRDGGLVAFATETVYGLGALGLDTTSVQKIFDAKGRPSHNPLILHVASIEQARALFHFAHPKSAQRFELLAQKFWPGPLTIVCDKADHVPDVITAGSTKVAVRIPSHAVALQLLKLVAQPVAAPSANASGRPSATSAGAVLKTLDGRIDAVLDAGPCEHGLESTVVDISGDIPVILRTGAISVATLQTTLPELVTRTIGIECHDANGSPGQLASHYAPMVNHIQLASAAELTPFWDSPCTILIRENTHDQLSKRLGLRPTGRCDIMPSDPIRYGQELYEALYRVENPAMDLVIERPPQTAEWLAINDRLIRACARC